MGRRFVATLVAFSLLLWAATESSAQVNSTIELEEELGRRQADLDRARERLDDLAAEISELESLVLSSKEKLGRAEDLAAQQAAVLYRLTNRGALVRYLLGSDSPVELLRRLGFLRALSLNALEVRRQAGLHLAQLEERLASTLEAQLQTQQLIGRLQDTIQEIASDIAKIAGPKATALRSRSKVPRLEPTNWNL
jgi:cell division protein FtsB